MKQKTCMILILLMGVIWTSGCLKQTESGQQEGTAVLPGDKKEIFTERDKKQIPDLSDAKSVIITDSEDIVIDTEGVYVLSGSGKNVTVTVEAGKEAKVQIVLDGVEIANDGRACVYVKEADKVFLTAAENSDNFLSVTGSFGKDGNSRADAVIFSKEDLVLNGMGKLTVRSSDNGIFSEDSVKITGGTLVTEAEHNGIEAQESILIGGGDITVNAGNDGLQAKDREENRGSFFMEDGSLKVNCADDAVHAAFEIVIDGGVITLSGREGLESTIVTVNDGEIFIDAGDDGINAGRKSRAARPEVAINGGMIRILAEGEEADGIDSNGDIIIRSGTVDITSERPFDCKGKAEYTGGTILINGEKVRSIPITE